MAKNTNAEMHDTSTKVKPLGTHANEVLKVSDVNVTVLNPDALNDRIVIAKDEDGIYMTVKTNVDSGLLDGFKVYHREKYPVSQTVNADGETIYTVKCGETSISI